VNNIVEAHDQTEKLNRTFSSIEKSPAP